jgi:phosphoribosylformylglycinamidine synthase
LPSAGERVLQGPGENAGVLDLGDGTAVAFKVESHNHPSAVEPFQGAATGIGGILRDVIAMGARPIALLDGLWFGEPDFHFQQAVAGIGHYGNCVGVPTVGGQTVFDPAYASNCLVNAMCVGLLDAERLRSAKASGAGKIVVLYGATTGRDGIGGASVLASAELSEDDADKRPSVQVGDPFTGKKLIEVSLELVDSGLVESLQDCGAAGLASALSEMASGGVGIDVHLDRVPLREEGMEPWEIMISESQERMVAVVRPEMLDAVHEICARWELPCTAIGEVTGSGALRAFHDGARVGDIPAQLLTDECPRYEIEERAEGRSPRRPEPPAFDVREVIEQYDHLVGSRTVRRPGLDAAVLRLRPAIRGLAVALQGPAAGETDGFRAGVQATLGAARNVACAGGEPIGFTDCLNFGNPEKPAIAHELAQAIEGIAQAAEALGIPVVSGNVSLYNDADGASIPPTPVVGCVGLVPDVRTVPGRWRSGDAVLLASSPDGSLAAEAALIRFLWKAAAAPEPLPRRRRQRHRRRPRRGGSLERRPRGGGRDPGGLRLAARRRDPRLPAWADQATRRAWLRADRGGALGMCGVFGVYAPDRDVARLTYFGLFALQHRGQESAGIAVSEHGRLTGLRDLGLVSQVFDEQKLGGLRGQVAIGHTRYSTTGSSHWANAQPLVQHGRVRTVALGHNGNLINVGELRDALREEGVPLGTTSDSELIAGAHRQRCRAARRGRGECHAAAGRRLLDRRALRGTPRRVPRPARLPARS